MSAPTPACPRRVAAGFFLDFFEEDVMVASRAVEAAAAVTEEVALEELALNETGALSSSGSHHPTAHSPRRGAPRVARAALNPAPPLPSAPCAGTAIRRSQRTKSSSGWGRRALEGGFAGAIGFARSGKLSMARTKISLPVGLLH
jgi:hypothetical protein